MAEEVLGAQQHEESPVKSAGTPPSRKRGPEDVIAEIEVGSPRNSQGSGRGAKRPKTAQAQPEDGRRADADGISALTSSRRTSDFSGVPTASSVGSVQGEEEDGKSRASVGRSQDVPDVTVPAQTQIPPSPGNELFVKDGLQFKVPRYSPKPEEPQGGIDWIREFIALNAEMAPSITTPLMADALDHHCTVAEVSRKRRKAARREFAQAMKVVPLDGLDERNIDRKLKPSFWKRVRGTPQSQAPDSPAVTSGSNSNEPSVPGTPVKESQEEVVATPSQPQPSGQSTESGPSPAPQPPALETHQGIGAVNGGPAVAQINGAQRPQPQPPQTPTALGDMDEDEELRMQKLYFCSAPDPSQMCLVCAGSDHRYRQCPMLTCKFCSLPGHFASRCPTRGRCLRCYQLGHQQNHCQSNLQAAADRKKECAFCRSAQHVEDECEEMWRSFDPSKEPIRRVNSVTAYCAMCGSQGHYIAECQSSRPGSTTAGSTWSMSNRARYVDPECGEEGIEKPGRHSAPGAKRALPAFGRAGGGRSIAPTTHVRFSESDDSESDFISQPVRRHASTARIGGIHFASNLSLPQIPPQPATQGFRPINGNPTLASRVTSGPSSLPERPVKSATWNGNFGRNDDGGRGRRGAGGRGRGGQYRGGRYRGGKPG